MILTDQDVKKQFPHGASIVDEEDEDALPLRGSLEPNPDNPDVLDLWITDGANTVLPREVGIREDGHYFVNHHGRTHTLTPLSKGVL